jgi:type VI secretion system protein ImpF
MSRINPQQGLKASLLDRLINPESDGTASQPGCTVLQMIDSVRRDLEDLLNTHRTVSELPAELVEVDNSLITYGMPDLSSYQSTKAEAGSLVGERIERAIARFEPRLRDVRARLIEDATEKQLKLKFEIHATLRVDPSPEVAFVTILKLSTGETSIQKVDT